MQTTIEQQREWLALLEAELARRAEQAREEAARCEQQTKEEAEREERAWYQFFEELYEQGQRFEQPAT